VTTLVDPELFDHQSEDTIIDNSTNSSSKEEKEVEKDNNLKKGKDKVSKKK
jgi:hypothetical protein